MPDRCRCCRCVHYEQKQAPQGTCEVTKQSTLAWWGCKKDFVKEQK